MARQLEKCGQEVELVAMFDKASGGAGGEAAAPVKSVEKPAGETKK